MFSYSSTHSVETPSSQVLVQVIKHKRDFPLIGFCFWVQSICIKYTSAKSCHGWQCTFERILTFKRIFCTTSCLIQGEMRYAYGKECMIHRLWAYQFNSRIHPKGYKQQLSPLVDFFISLLFMLRQKKPPKKTTQREAFQPRLNRSVRMILAFRATLL